MQSTSLEPLEPGRSELVARVDGSSLEDEQLDAFVEHGGAGRIASAVTQKLLDLPGLDRRDSRAVHVIVTRFQLRSPQRAFWLFLSGSDDLEVSVKTVRDGVVEKRFEASASITAGSLVQPGSAARFERMADEIAARIAEEI